MRTLRLKVYKFDELSDEAQQNALNELSDINVDPNWWDFTYEDAKDIGLKITSFNLDRNRHANGEFILAANEVAQNVLNYHGENCETYKITVSFMEVWQPIFNTYMETEEGEDELMEIEEQYLKDLLSEYSQILQNESEYLQSKESIKETILANDWDFLENGKMYL